MLKTQLSFTVVYEDSLTCTCINRQIHIDTWSSALQYVWLWMQVTTLQHNKMFFLFMSQWWTIWETVTWLRECRTWHSYMVHSCRTVWTRVGSPAESVKVISCYSYSSNVQLCLSYVLDMWERWRDGFLIYFIQESYP